MKQVEEEVGQRLPAWPPERRPAGRRSWWCRRRRGRRLLHRRSNFQRVTWRRGRDGFHAVRPIEAGASEQLDLAAVFARLDAVAVELQFMQPSLVGAGRTGRPAGQLRMDELRKLFFGNLQAAISNPGGEGADFLAAARSLSLRYQACRWRFLLSSRRGLRCAGDLFEAAPGHDAVGRLLGDRRVVAGRSKSSCSLISSQLGFDLVGAFAAHADQRPFALHLSCRAG
jgi:hypothetical protein